METDGDVLMTRICVSIYQFKDGLYYVPIARAEGLGVLQYVDAVSILESSSCEDKGIKLLEILELAGKEIQRPSHLPDAFRQRIESFLVLTKVKTWKTFVENAKELDVELENSVLLFGPNEYERGGFSGLKEAKFEIPANSSLECIGQAIEYGLSLCIGKNSESK